jgi:RNA polymerase sigma-70 factor (ECF subfamily)
VIMHGHEGRKIDIEKCYVRYGAMVWRRCRQMLHDEDEAYDTMQEVFVKLMVCQEKIYSDYMSSLLYRIATNLCLNKLRVRRRRGPVESLETAAAVAGQELQRHEKDYRALLEQILQSEKEDIRQIAFMYYFDGMKMQKIAAVMAMSTAAVHKRLKKLRRHVKEAENG